MSAEPEPTSQTRRSRPGAGIAVGVAIGVALGAAFDQLAMGIALGTAFGAALDLVSHERRGGRP
jgi:high-affinity Fe2+/Pb2+ permease